MARHKVTLGTISHGTLRPKAPTTYMGIDQFGHTYHGLRHPRKELSKILPGRVSKMYQDTKDGKTVHVGYVIGPNWVTLYRVLPFKEAEA